MRTRSMWITALAVVAATAGAAVPADAIKNGVFDGEAHPYVGIMVAKDAAGQKLWRCTGTLVSPTVFLTAGHCTAAPAASASVWFDADITSNAGDLGYPDGGSLTGAVLTHPDYDADNFIAHDLGVVVLDQAITMPEYGLLPALDQLDSLVVGKKTVFTTLGYGLRKDVGGFKNDVAITMRMVATPHLVGIGNGQAGPDALTLSNNASTGGTCSGDSGGPNFLGSSRVIAGVTSYGYGQSCGGISGVYRIDRADDLGWLASLGI